MQQNGKPIDRDKTISHVYFLYCPRNEVFFKRETETMEV